MSPAPVAAILAALLLAGGAAADDSAVEVLLRLHHEQRAAHALGDAPRLVGQLAPDFREIAGGRVRSPGLEAVRERFERYFAAVRFLEWEDVRPPRIALSPDGRWAEVVVEKRLRLVPAGPGGDEVHRRYAWLERWRRSADGWRMASLASTDDGAATDPDPVPLAARVRAEEILRRARRAMGGEAAVAEVAMSRWAAECVGPHGPFRTEVASARDGRVAFVQRFPSRPTFAAGVELGGAWVASGGEAGPSVERSEALPPPLASVVAAHEFHLLVLAPESRYRAPAALAAGEVDGRPVDVVELRDAFGAAVRFEFDRESGLPVAFRPVDHGGGGPSEVVVRFADWRPVGDVRLPFAVRITQGDDDFRCTVATASVGWLEDRAFAPPG